MATFEYTVECIYETDKGNGKDYTPFNTKFVLSRFREEGAGSHIVRRFLPLAIKGAKNKPLFSGIRHWVITDVQKLNDEFPLEGKEIKAMNEQEIQELACMYDLFEIPLPSTTSISELREKAMIAYMKQVLKIPMKTPEEQEKLDFFVRQPDGSLKLDLGDRKLLVEVKADYLGRKEEVKKLSLDDFIGKSAEQSEGGVTVTAHSFTDESEGKSQEQSQGQDGNFPNAKDLVNGFKQAIGI